MGKSDRSCARRAGDCAGLRGRPAHEEPAPEPIPELVLPKAWHFELTGYGWASSTAGFSGIRNLPAVDYYGNFRRFSSISTARSWAGPPWLAERDADAAEACRDDFAERDVRLRAEKRTFGI